MRGKGREQEGPPAGACAGQADAGRRRDRAEAQARRTLEDGGAGAYVGARKAGESVREQREENGPDEGRSECEPMRAENETPVNGRLLGQRAAHGRHGEAGWQRGQGACGLDCARTDAEEQGGAGTIPHEEKAGFADGPGGMPFALEAGAVFTLPARDGEYALGAAQIGQLQAAFPELDLAGELRAMDSWLRANPQGVRPAGMMPRFVDGWLRNAQKRVCRPVARGDTVERFLALAQQMERET